MAKKGPFRGMRFIGKRTITEVDGLKFGSRREAGRWLYLKAREQRGEISCLRRQVPFDMILVSKLTGEPTTLTRYYSDFCYIDAGGVYHVEDSKPKGMMTEKAELKLLLMQILHGIKVELV